MPSPFPGMDPFLEHPDLWPDVHHGLIEAVRDFLAPKLRPRYRVALEKRVYLSEPEGLVLLGRPDVAVVRGHRSADSSPPDGSPAATSAQSVTVEVPMPEVVEEGYLEVRDVATGEVITALELLSPSNKRHGEGRRMYEIKRRRVLGSLTHLVEIDLLRGGDPMPVLSREIVGRYRILISRSEERPKAMLHAFGVRDAIPGFLLPLRAGEVGPRVELRDLIGALYDRAGYDLAVDYTGEPVPPLEDEDAAWADRLLREKRLRPS